MEDSLELARKIADAQKRIAKSECTDIGCIYAYALGGMTSILGAAICYLMEGKPEKALQFLKEKAEE